MTRRPSTRPARRWSTLRADGDRGSLVLAMLVTLVATSVAALILPVLITSTKSTTFDDRRTQQLAAAESGVQTIVARIRGSVDATGTPGTGLLSALPCGDVIGSVLGSAKLRFKANVQYYNGDPNILDALGKPVAKVVTCAVALGKGVVATPGFAKIVAWGTDVAGADPATVANRRVEATYVVKTTNANIVGGLFRVNKPATAKNDLCLDAGSNPQVGGAVTVQLCDSSSPSQIWAYNKTLTVSLVSSRVKDASGVVTSEGLCIDGSASEDLKVALTLGACGTTSTPSRQMWSMNDNASMEGTKTNGLDRNGRCWAVNVADSPGSSVVLTDQCTVSPYGNKYHWIPEAAVGAGASGATYGELVDYKQFGRCLDITNVQVDSKYLIAWPCKQQPDPTKVLWNQRWTLPTIGADGTGVGQIYTVSGNDQQKYCLTSPLTAAAHNYVVVKLCPATVTQATKWTVRTQTGSMDTNFQIEDWSGDHVTKPGLCLQPTDPTATPPDLAAEGTSISKIVVAACTRSTLQKWNAPPDLEQPSIKDQSEK